MSVCVSEWVCERDNVLFLLLCASLSLSHLSLSLSLSLSVCLCVQSREQDVNGDGLPDNLTVNISVPLLAGEDVAACSLLLFFDFQLQVSIQYIFIFRFFSTSSVSSPYVPFLFFLVIINFFNNALFSHTLIHTPLMFISLSPSLYSLLPQEHIALEMESAAVIQYEAAGSGGAGLIVAGSLRWRQDEPLPHEGTRSIYNVNLSGI